MLLRKGPENYFSHFLIQKNENTGKQKTYRKCFEQISNTSQPLVQSSCMLDLPQITVSPEIPGGGSPRNSVSYTLEQGAQEDGLGVTLRPALRHLQSLAELQRQWEAAFSCWSLWGDLWHSHEAEGSALKQTAFCIAKQLQMPSELAQYRHLWFGRDDFWGIVFT